MAKEYAKAFYNSSEWRKLRNAFFQSKFGICERCGSPGKIVHHKIYITEQNIDDPNVTLNPDNLELLCKACHDAEHDVLFLFTGGKNKQKSIRDGFGFDEDGNFKKLN